MASGLQPHANDAIARQGVGPVLTTPSTKPNPAQALRASLGPAAEVARIFDAFENFQRAYHQQGTSSQARMYFRLLTRYTEAAQRRRELES